MWLWSKEKSDKEIIENILSGGRDKEIAIDYLIHRHTGMVIRVMNKTAISEEDAKDAFTDALLAVIKNIKDNKFVPKSKLSTYLYQILYYKCVDRARKKTIYQNEPIKSVIDIKDETPDIYRIIKGKRELNLLHHLLTELGDPCKSILLKWGAGGYTMNEIAEMTGLESAEKAKKKKHYCLKVLMKKIRQKNINIDIGKGRNS
jgi:RNA polymerase sigma-70 factor (ECF subfamily)